MTTTHAKTILITGATAGIGRHAALHLARKGHRVFATGRNEASLASLREEAAGTSLETFRLDVTDAVSIAAVKAAVEERTEGRGVDVLVNNAGYGAVGPVEALSDSEVRAQYETNVFGLMAMTRAFLPAMRERGAGRVINVSSMGGRVTFPFFGVYNSTKYAVEALSDALRQELAVFGVDVILLEPGVIRTEFSDRAMAFVGRHRDSASPYAWALARADEMKAQTDAMAVGPEVTTRALEHAITARRPRARYVAPFRTNTILWLKALLPTRALDAILRAAAGLTRRQRTRMLALNP